MALQIGDKVVVIGPKTFDHHFTEGDVVTYTGEDNDIPTHHRGHWRQFKRGDEQFTQYLLAEHFKPYKAPKVSGEIVEKVVDTTLPTKASYAVFNAHDEIVATTADRDYARELKAALGGKRKGIRIFSYVADKEIR